MSTTFLRIEQSLGLHGQTDLIGAKNAVLVIMASLILTEGKSVLTNVPCSDDVLQMIDLLADLGAQIYFCKEEHRLEVDTRTLIKCKVKPDIMKKMRASILVMGPLLARFGKTDVAAPGGCVIGTRPINFHLDNFKKMGVQMEQQGDFISAQVDTLKATKLVLEYPSVGATENLMMAATLTPGVTKIVNAALEPEVLDLVDILKKMGAKITILPPATIEIEGVSSLNPVTHSIIPDRLETGALLLAAAITGGSIYLPQARADMLDIFLLKLQEMGHLIQVGPQEFGIKLTACSRPKAVSIKTAPYPGFPTDLQAPMMAAQCLAEGTSLVEETVFENRLLHIGELQKMGAQIKVDHNKATITGVEELYGTQVIATDIRASCALVLAGMAAKGTTIMTGIHHFRRGYEALEKKLILLGASIQQQETCDVLAPETILMDQKEKIFSER